MIHITIANIHTSVRASFHCDIQLLIGVYLKNNIYINCHPLQPIKCFTKDNTEN